MKKLAFIAALLSSAAIAQADDRQWNNDHHGDYNEHQGDYRDARTGDRVQVIPLASMDISRKQTVDIGRQAGRFRTMRVQAQRGAAYIDFIEVRYGNGQQEHVDVKRRIGRGETADIDIAGRYIEAVTVHGSPDRWSRIQLIGLR